jgi:Family of unknown function (DUF6152)
MLRRRFTHAVMILAGSLGAATCAPAAWAHHSFAAYDMSKSVVVKGTIKEFRWSAPHSSLILTTLDAKGEPVDLMIVAGAPNIFARQGFKSKDFRTGDKVELVYHPNRNGSHGGALATLTLPDGRVARNGEVQDAASGANVPGPPQ